MVLGMIFEANYAFNNIELVSKEIILSCFTHIKHVNVLGSMNQHDRGYMLFCYHVNELAHMS